MASGDFHSSAKRLSSRRTREKGLARRQTIQVAADAENEFPQTILALMRSVKSNSFTVVWMRIAKPILQI
jgi:hypothetical protein